MKISEAKRLYSSELNVLWMKKQELTKQLKEEPAAGQDVDRVEISQQLKDVSERYDQVHKGMEQIQLQETLIHNAETAKQQSEVISDASEEMLKCIEIARRISNGDKVPASDEKRLMDYDSKMYLAAKNMAMTKRKKKPKEYDSLWKDEENAGAEGEEPSASEIAENSEISIAAPDQLAGCQEI